MAAVDVERILADLSAESRLRIDHRGCRRRFCRGRGQDDRPLWSDTKRLRDRGSTGIQGSAQRGRQVPGEQQARLDRFDGQPAGQNRRLAQNDLVATRAPTDLVEATRNPVSQQVAGGRQTPEAIEHIASPFPGGPRSEEQRASCKENVCQYGEISWGPLALKKK